MSYDISVRVKVENVDYFLRVPLDKEPNITWNVRELILQSSDWDIANEASNGLAVDLYPKILKGIENLTLRPQRYKKYESPNGWGTVGGTLSFYHSVKDMIDEFLSHYEELRDVGVIWVD